MIYFFKLNNTTSILRPHLSLIGIIKLYRPLAPLNLFIMPHKAINTKAILLILIPFFGLVGLYNVYQLSLFQQRNDCADKSAQPSLSQVKQDKSAQPSLSQVKHQDQQDDVYNYTYAPSSAEKYIRFNAEELGFSSEKDPKGCNIWEDPNVTNADIHSGLVSYASEVNEHAKAVKNFKPIPDLLKSIVKTGNHSVCDTAKLHEDGLQALFPSKQLSLTNSGHVEPLLPPMRSQKFCRDESHLMSLDYLVHDFEAMCRKLKPTSKRILIDMGASLSFHGNSNQPIVTLLELYEKFGFNFDHIYGFEITFTEPKTVYEQLLPLKYFPNYHWINVGECLRW